MEGRPLNCSGFFILELEFPEEGEWDEWEDECQDEEYVVTVDETPGPAAGGGVLGWAGMAGADGGKLGGRAMDKLGWG